MRCIVAALVISLLLSGCTLITGVPTTPFEYKHRDTAFEVVGKTFANLPFWTVDLGFSAAFAAGYLWLLAQSNGHSSY